MKHLGLFVRASGSLKRPLTAIPQRQISFSRDQKVGVFALITSLHCKSGGVVERQAKGEQGTNSKIDNID